MLPSKGYQPCPHPWPAPSPPLYLTRLGSWADLGCHPDHMAAGKYALDAAFFQGNRFMCVSSRCCFAFCHPPTGFPTLLLLRTRAATSTSSIYGLPRTCTSSTLPPWPPRLTRSSNTPASTSSLRRPQLRFHPPTYPRHSPPPPLCRYPDPALASKALQFIGANTPHCSQQAAYAEGFQLFS